MAQRRTSGSLKEDDEKAGELPALQARSRATRDRLLATAEAIMRGRGTPEFTMAEVAAGADCSVGGAYRRFADKESLLEALHDRWVGDSVARATELVHPSLWADKDVIGILQSYLEIATRITREQGQLSRVLFLLVASNDSYAERANEAQAIIDRGLHRLLRARKKEIGHPKPDLAITHVLEQIRASLMARRFGGPVHQPSRVSDADFIRETARSAARYLDL